MKQHYLFMSLMVSFMALIMTGCMIPLDERHYLYLTVKGCETSQTCGLYILNEQGVLVNSNVPIKIDENGEDLEKDLNHQENNTYFLYFPYTDSPSNMPETGEIVETRNPHDFFHGLRTEVKELKVARGQASICGSHTQIFFLSPAEQEE